METVENKIQFSFAPRCWYNDLIRTIAYCASWIGVFYNHVNLLWVEHIFFTVVATKK